VSEQLFGGLPPLPPARPMTEDDWARLEARIDVAIETHERSRRRRLVLATAAALLVLAVAVAATWWHSTRPTAGSASVVSVACASAASTTAPVTAMLASDGSDPRSQCEREWRTVGVGGAPGPPPAQLVACSHEVDETPVVLVVPDATAGTCARLGLAELPADFADSNERFAALREAIGTFDPQGGGPCVPYRDVRRTTEDALERLGYDGWEVARGGATIVDDSTCVDYWVADRVQHVVFLYGPGIDATGGP